MQPKKHENARVSPVSSLFAPKTHLNLTRSHPTCWRPWSVSYLFYLNYQNILFMIFLSEIFFSLLDMLLLDD